MLLIGTFIARSMYRNFEWITEERLFKSALNVCPHNAKVHYNIAKVFNIFNFCSRQLEDCIVGCC